MSPAGSPRGLRAAAFVLAAVVSHGAGCRRDDAGGAGRFRDVTLELGLPARPSYPEGRHFMPEIIGSGLALIDYDGDGDLDIYQVAHPPPARPFAAQLSTPASSRLYRRETGGRYSEVPEAGGAAVSGYGQGVAVGDVDDDGFADLYVTCYGAAHLYRNVGGGFEDTTARAGLDDDASRLWGASAAFLDFDQDGRLDLFAVHYVQFDPGIDCPGEGGKPEYCGPIRFTGAPAALYRNRGAGRFTNVTAAAGVERPGRGLGVACADFTGDGLVDVYVANDRDPNFLWVNRGDGTFRDEGLARGVALSGAGSVESSMGVAVGDVDSNGLLDILVTNLNGETNTLYVAQEGGQFADRSATSGLSAVDLPYTGWGCAFIDLDGDGDLDLAIVNGRIARGRSDAEGAPDPTLGAFWREYAEHSLLFENDGAGKFTSFDARGGAFTAAADNLRGLAAGDLDGDGDEDLVATGVDNALHVFENRGAPRHHWLRVRAMAGRRDALGALLTFRVADAAGAAPARALVRPVMASQSYLSSGDPRMTVGLGGAARVESIDVGWPDGKRERFAIAAGSIDCEVVLREGGGRAE